MKKYNGVILPDFSIHRDMPYAMQIWNIYRSRAIGHWLQINGVKVIPNIRYGDRRTYKICCDGIEKKSVIAIGSHGTIKHAADRMYFTEGLDSVVRKLEPVALVIYGAVPGYIFDKYGASGIEIISFDSDYAISHKEVV